MNEEITSSPSINETSGPSYLSVHLLVSVVSTCGDSLTLLTSTVLCPNPNQVILGRELS